MVMDIQHKSWLANYMIVSLLITIEQNEAQHMTDCGSSHTH